MHKAADYYSSIAAGQLTQCSAAGVQLFDAGMYGVGAAEALAMDPQQRLLLEAATQLMQGGAPGEHLGGKVCTPSSRFPTTLLPAPVRRHCSNIWQFLKHHSEQAGAYAARQGCNQVPYPNNQARVQGPGGRSGGVGVYVGMSYSEYGTMVLAATPTVSAFTATGSSLSVAAGAGTCSQNRHAGPVASGEGVIRAMHQHTRCRRVLCGLTHCTWCMQSPLNSCTKFPMQD